MITNLKDMSLPGGTRQTSREEASSYRCKAGEVISFISLGLLTSKKNSGSAAKMDTRLRATGQHSDSLDFGLLGGQNKSFKNTLMEECNYSLPSVSSRTALTGKAKKSSGLQCCVKIASHS